MTYEEYKKYKKVVEDYEKGGVLIKELEEMKEKMGENKTVALYMQDAKGKSLEVGIPEFFQYDVSGAIVIDVDEAIEKIKKEMQDIDPEEDNYEWYNPNKQYMVGDQCKYKWEDWTKNAGKVGAYESLTNGNWSNPSTEPNKWKLIKWLGSDTELGK